MADTLQPPGATVTFRSVQPAGRLMALPWMNTLPPRSETGSPLSVTRTLMTAEASALAPEPPAVALPRLICICTSSSPCGAWWVRLFAGWAMVRLRSPGSARPPAAGAYASRRSGCADRSRIGRFAGVDAEGDDTGGREADNGVLEPLSEGLSA